MRIALLQMTSGIDPARNEATLCTAVKDAAEGGAAMLFTPEMSGLIDSNRERARPHILPVKGHPVLEAVCEAARAAAVWVHLGSLAIDAGDRWANRAFLIDASGQIRARYDKLHLFDVDLPTGESWRESASYVPGQGTVVADTPVGPLGLSICYDIWFPETTRTVTAMGAEVILHPVMTHTIDRDVDLNIAKASAAMFQAYVFDINGLDKGFKVLPIADWAALPARPISPPPKPMPPEPGTPWA